eukprot:10302450-Alexandrium_andersonii.AAC.1
MTAFFGVWSNCMEAGMIKAAGLRVPVDPAKMPGRGHPKVVHKRPAWAAQVPQQADPGREG